MAAASIYFDGDLLRCPQTVPLPSSGWTDLPRRQQHQAAAAAAPTRGMADDLALGHGNESFA
jgi:hypothetical protein